MKQATFVKGIPTFQRHNIIIIMTGIHLKAKRETGTLEVLVLSAKIMAKKMEKNSCTEERRRGTRKDNNKNGTVTAGENSYTA